MNSEPQDETRCAFLESGEAADFADTASRAALVDDICEDGPRELTPIERLLADRMMDERDDARRRKRRRSL